MSIEVELRKKSGKVCKQALDGTIHCPCIVRSTSEDVVVGNVFGILRHIRPHLWLNDLLNTALRTNRFRQAWFKGFSVRFWERQERFPPELLDFREGRTEPDIIIEWENPPTTIWIEAKWGSRLAEGTTGNRNNDQVIRGVRTLLAQTGHLALNRLIEIPKRRPIWLGLLNWEDDPVLERYRTSPQVDALVRFLVGSDSELNPPIVGWLNWAWISRFLHEKTNQMLPLERSLTRSVADYIDFKLTQLNQNPPSLPLLPSSRLPGVEIACS